MEIEHSTAQNLEYSIKTILSYYDDINRDGIKDSPKRILKAWNELLIAEEPKITLFKNEGYNGIIKEAGIEYYTFCEHHFLPFFGKVSIGYIPRDYYIGLSKLSRIVDYFSKRLNTQEKFTANIANYIDKILKPYGVAVIVSGRHLCKEMRGIKRKGIMKTSKYIGVFRDNKDLIREFMSL